MKLLIRQDEFIMMLILWRLKCDVGSTKKRIIIYNHGTHQAILQMAAPGSAGGEDSCEVQNLAVDGREETYTEVVFGGSGSDHPVHEPARGLLQAVRI